MKGSLFDRVARTLASDTGADSEPLTRRDVVVRGMLGAVAVATAGRLSLPEPASAAPAGCKSLAACLDRANTAASNANHACRERTELSSVGRVSRGRVPYLGGRTRRPEGAPRLPREVPTAEEAEEATQAVPSRRSATPAAEPVRRRRERVRQLQLGRRTVLLRFGSIAPLRLREPDHLLPRVRLRVKGQKPYGP